MVEKDIHTPMNIVETSKFDPYHSEDDQMYY